jgi:hypothetical protein
VDVKGLENKKYGVFRMVKWRDSHVLPSPLEGVWGSKSPRVCREVNGMRLVRRSLHFSVGVGVVGRQGKIRGIALCCHSGLDPESRFLRCVYLWRGLNLRY